MSAFKRLVFGSCIFALLFTLTPGAKASDIDQKVVATFSGPVQVPGRILPTGTYVFKLLPVLGTRDIVQVSNADETQVLATAFTIPRYRSTPTDNAVFVLEERGDDSPQALQAWYYPGYIDGHQFIYRNAAYSAAAPALSNEAPANPPNAPVEPSPAMSEEPKMSEPAPEAIADSTPSTDQVQTTQSQTTPDASMATSGTTSDQTNKELPKTASTTPLIALIGMLLLGGAVGLKILASRLF